MVLDIDTQLASDGATLTNNGKLEATKLQLARSGSPAPQPVKMDYAVTHHLEERKGEVSDLSIHAGSVAAHVTGSYDAAGDGVALDLHLSAPDLPIDQVEKLLPAFGVRLPTGSGLKGGALKASLAITGPATSPMIAGPVEIDNTQLEGFDLGSKIQNMNPFGTKGGGTAIQTLRANVKNDSQATQLTDIYVVIEKIGTATGTGTVTAGGNLDFKMVAKLSAISGATAATGKAVSEVTGQATSLLGGFMGKGKAANAKNTSTKSGNGGGIPITITGTTADPIIHANPLGMFK
jgi:AsmA protein